MPALDETHPDFLPVRDTFAAIQGALEERGPHEPRAVLCGLAVTGALFLESKGLLDRRKAGALLAKVVEGARGGGTDGSGTLDALAIVAIALQGRSDQGGADGPD